MGARSSDHGLIWIVETLANALRNLIADEFWPSATGEVGVAKKKIDTVIEK